MEDVKVLQRSKLYSVRTLKKTFLMEKHVLNSKILVVGGAGSIGSAVVKELIQMGAYSIHVIDISENNLVELVRDIRSSFANISTQLKTFCIDVGANEFEKFKFSGNNYDYVMNFSAMKHVRSERDPFSLMRMVKTNVINAYELARACYIFKAKKYFCVSTDKAANPENLMGASKRAMEILLLHAEQIPHLNLARFANVAYSDGSLLAGSKKGLRKDNLFPRQMISNVILFHISKPQACVYYQRSLVGTKRYFFLVIRIFLYQRIFNFSIRLFKGTWL